MAHVFYLLVSRPRNPPSLLRVCCQCVPRLLSAATSLLRVGSESAAVRFWGWAAPVLRRTNRTPQPLQLISPGGAESWAGMRGALLLGAASYLEGGMGQDTGGPFKGSLAISRQTPGHCVDNRNQVKIFKKNKLAPRQPSCNFPCVFYCHILIHSP